MDRIDGEPVLDRPSVGDVELFFASAGPETRGVRLRLTRKGGDRRGSAKSTEDPRRTVPVIFRADRRQKVPGLPG